MKTLTALMTAVLLSGFSQPSIAAEPVEVSMIQLISNPKDYDGKVVRVVGFVSLEFEGQAIYLHQDDYKHCIYKNGLWIDLTDEIRKKKSELDHQYLMIEGTFVSKRRGHMGLWSGSLERISKVRVWFERREHEK